MKKLIILSPPLHESEKRLFLFLSAMGSTVVKVIRDESSLGNEWCRAMAHDFSADKSSGQRGRSSQYKRLEKKRRELVLNQITSETRVKDVV
jgi:hypothetical protein